MYFKSYGCCLAAIITHWVKLCRSGSLPWIAYHIQAAECMTLKGIVSRVYLLCDLVGNIIRCLLLPCGLSNVC